MADLSDISATPTLDSPVDHFSGAPSISRRMRTEKWEDDVTSRAPNDQTYSNLRVESTATMFQ